MIAPGSIIGHRYRIVELIGAGGMANVYLAINLTSRKQVAIKVLKEEYSNDAEFLRRFEREAKAVLHLEHDNIVRAYGVGEADGLPYIVLEFIEGQTLKQIITENGPMPARLAVSMGLQVLDALGAAHRSGIIHRDVKPQNVIVTPEGKCMLTDFGIARDARTKTITFAGSTILGSVHYISPEQAQGKPVSEASDLYSVGVLLYELLTAKLPFDADNSVAIALMHINDDAVPPIQLNPKIPPSLNDVIMRALNRNLGERYATAREMSKQLRRTLTEPAGDFARVYAPEQATTSNTGDPMKRRRKRVRLHGALKIGISVAALVFALICVFFMLRGIFARQSEGVEIVPVLTQRSVEEAISRAEDFGFQLEVREFEVSESVPFGDVILQTPESGVKAKRGTTIQVIVSSGLGTPVVPDLIGRTPEEAKTALEAVGLKAGSIEYIVSDVAIGYVCWQQWPTGQELTAGTLVDFKVSATASSTVDMPMLNGEVMNLALDILAKNGFTRVFIRQDLGSTEENGLVIAQLPPSGRAVLLDAPVYLTVSASDTYAFAADAAMNVDVPENDTEVFVTLLSEYNGFAYERILYETTMQKGAKLPISFTAYSDTEGVGTLTLYVNGMAQSTREISFIARDA